MWTDYDTDAVIQRTLRTELPRDATVLTVAHRLQTNPAFYDASPQGSKSDRLSRIVDGLESSL